MSGSYDGRHEGPYQPYRGGHPQPQPPQTPFPPPAPPPPVFQTAIYRQPVFHPSLPVQPTEYQMFWRAPSWRWWRPIVGLIVGVLIMLVLAIMLSSGAVALDILTGRLVVDGSADLSLDQLMSPALFLANNVVLAGLIPVAFLISAAVFKQRPGFVSSVVGNLRWRWLARCLAIITPLWLVMIGIEWILSARDGGLDGIGVNADTWLLVVGILITTPLQSAGEEYGFRGAINRLAASFFANKTAGLVVGLIVSSTAFMFAHSAADPWLNTYYFFFGATSCILVWRTGGLEASIVMHVVNNVLSEAALPFSDLSGLFDRSAGTAGPEVLIQMGVVAVATALICWQAKRTGVVTATAPVAEMAVPQAPNQSVLATNQPLINPRPWESGNQARPDYS